MMPLCVVFGDVAIFPVTISTTSKLRTSRFKLLSSTGHWNQKSTGVRYESLRVLEWDKLCDSVASYARTSLGREATKAQLWSLDHTFQDSLRLLQETDAAVRMRHSGSCSLDFTSVDLSLVQSALQRVRGSLPLAANEATSLLSLLQVTEALQLNLKAAIKEDADWYERFLPLSSMIFELVINRGLINSIQQVMDEDGSVKDSASPALRKARDQVRTLERKLHQLLEILIRHEMDESSSMKICNFHGRWCIMLGVDQPTTFKGLLLSSGPGTDSVIEPLPAVSSNDDLQQARAQAAKAEEDVLMLLTEKIKMDVEDIEKILGSAIQLDVINARASFSSTFGGTSPDIFLPVGDEGSSITQSNCQKNELSNASTPRREWTIFLPKAYHPLLLQQHRHKLQKARKDVRNAASELKIRNLQGDNAARKGVGNPDLSSLESQVKLLEQACPVPVDFFIARKTRVVVITGPNTGGKTICLKTVGLAAMMAKTGLYVLASESAQIPWFDSVFADIGDEQSLSQSLSTFSGHLKQISDIKSESTSRSLVLLDEVGAGTNPLEGAALGMSLLESFAESRALLTIATTHHGELKILKYSNDAFENACVEFDEENLKPTYKILWGVPGRSNAINIAKRLGLSSLVIDNARALYGVASAEIDEVIIDMERFKQDYRELVHEARKSLARARGIYEKLSVARSKLTAYSADAQYKKAQELSEAAASASSLLRNKIRQLRASSMRQRFHDKAKEPSLPKFQEQTRAAEVKHSAKPTNASSMPDVRAAHSEKSSKFPKVGDPVYVSSLGKKAVVLSVEPYKEEIVVQVGNMKLKLKLKDVRTW